MPFDGVDKVSQIPSGFEPAKIKRLNSDEVGEILDSAGTDTPETTSDDKSRLGKVFNLIKEAQRIQKEKKRKGESLKLREALRVYQRVGLINDEEAPGQTLDVKG